MLKGYCNKNRGSVPLRLTRRRFPLTYTDKHSFVVAIARSCPRYKNLFKSGSFGILDIAEKLLVNDNEGFRTVSVDDLFVRMQANNTTVSDWMAVNRICKIAEKFDDDALNEGYTFSFELQTSLECLTLPDCDCSKRGYEIGDTVTIKGNCYDSNADTWASQLGIKAESMYLF